MVFLFIIQFANSKGTKKIKQSKFEVFDSKDGVFKKNGKSLNWKDQGICYV
jgi:hypothetical protein